MILKPALSLVTAIAFSIALASCSNSDEEPGETTPVADLEILEPAEPAEPVVDADEPAAGREGVAGDPTLDPDAPLVDPAGVIAPDVIALADAALEDTLYIELACGRVVIEMRPDLAPLHVARIKTLAREGFYDGHIFHRVIEGFMAQTGDPTGTGGGASPLPDLPAEFTSEPFVRGAVGMARGRDVDTANSQFFLMFTRYPSLDNLYTVWGHVTDGMDCVDQIARGEPPINPDSMLTVRVAADVQ